MDNNINDIDKFFKDSLGNHQSPYVPGAWDKMEAMLDAGDAGFLQKNMQRYILASIAGAIVLAGSVLTYISGFGTGQTMASKTVAVATAPQTNATETEANTSTINSNTATTANDATQAQNNVNSATPAASATATPSDSKKPEAKQNSNGVVPPAPVATSEPSNSQQAIPVAADDNGFTPANEEAPTVTEDKAIEKSTLHFAQLLSGKLPKFATLNGVENFSETLEAQSGRVDSSTKAQRKLDEMRHFYRWQIGIQAGGNFNRVISTTDNKMQIGNGYMAGLFVNKNINRQWAIGGELNYVRSNNNNVSRTISQTSYFFEKYTTNYFLVTKTFEYLQAPVYVSYALGRRHHVSFGAVGLLMLNARTEVIEQSQKHAERNTNSYTKTGIYEDLNSFNYGINLGYEYNLPGMYSVGMRYNQMFNSATNSSYFSNGSSSLPAHLQLYIKLNLTK